MDSSRQSFIIRAETKNIYDSKVKSYCPRRAPPTPFVTATELRVFSSSFVVHLSFLKNSEFVTSIKDTEFPFSGTFLRVLNQVDCSLDPSIIYFSRHTIFRLVKIVEIIISNIKRYWIFV